MSTTLSAAEIELSKQLGDYFSSTTTSTGLATSLIDTTLRGYDENFIKDGQAYDQITSGTYDTEERRITALDKQIWGLTVAPHSGAIASGVTYRIHTLFSATDKKRALIRAARRAYPFIYKEVRDENHTGQNWLRNGGFEQWTSASYPDYWRMSSVTAAAYGTLPWRGNYDMHLSTVAGYAYQDTTYNADLAELRGHTVTFTLKYAWCNTPNCLRIAISDAATVTYSDYHPGDRYMQELSVTATIAEDAASVSFQIYHDVLTADTYVDDARVIGPTRTKQFVDELSLVQIADISQSHDDYIQQARWEFLNNWELNTDGSLYLAKGTADYRLRIHGMGYLDFLVSGAASELWTATIDLNKPQTDILIAQAAVELYETRCSPLYPSGDRDKYLSELSRWQGKLSEAITKFSMKPLPITIQRTM